MFLAQDLQHCTLFNNRMPFSHHSHSGQFCSHGKNTLEEMIKGAIDKKFHVFALTEHMPRENDDLYPEEVDTMLHHCVLCSYPMSRLYPHRRRTRFASCLMPTSKKLPDYERPMHQRLKSSSAWRLIGFGLRRCNGLMTCFKGMRSISS